MTEITMPRLSDSMQDGTILAWLKADGEYVSVGEPLVEIETDKAAMTYAAESSGTLAILAAEGRSLPVGTPLARLSAATEPVPAASEPKPALIARSVSDQVPTCNGTEAIPPANKATPRGTKATPLARRVAELHGIRLEEVAGRGPLGRITRADVLEMVGVPTARSRAPQSPPPSEPPAQECSKGEVELLELNRLQATVARRMAQAKASVPHFQVQTEVAIDAAITVRAQIKQAGEAAPSLNDLIVKASALALRRHPAVNGSYRDGRFELYSRVNVGIAVAAQDALVVPTIFDADQKSLRTIAQEARGLAERVREGGITPAELAGATFTVSNLGMYGMTAITPVINVPQAAILGVGAVRDVLSREHGDIVDRQLMTLTLSCDHRILYGASAAQFLATIRELLRRPVLLML